MKRILKLLLTLLLAAVLALAAFITWRLQLRPGMDAYAAHAYPEIAPGEGGALTATWLGTTALLLRDGDSAILIDPFFTRPAGLLPLLRNARIAPDEQLISEWLRRAGAERLDAVLVTHSHYDHAMDAGVVAKLTGAMLVGSNSTANIGRGAGLPETQIHVVTPGVATVYGHFTFSFLESRHSGATGGRPTGEIATPLAPPARYFDYRQGGTFGVLIEHAEGRLLHHASAGWLPGMYAGRQADVVFLGALGIGDFAGYLQEVVDATGAGRVIPIHWDDFTRPLAEPLLPFPLADLDGFFRDCARLRPGLELQTLALGRTVPLFARQAQP